jgi:prephenate dehydrogenase
MVALPPQATMQFITHTQFAMGAVVCDICGVKQPIEQAAYSVTAPIRYVGMHPMAGKEVSGITNASETLFDRASMVITHGDKTDGQALDMAKKLTKDMGFARIVECTAAIHDRKIAYTSQLAHIVSNAYVKDDEINNCLGFTGGSFQDMTRIGGVDENMWSELYLLNSEQICQKIGTLIHNLKALQTAISSGDDIALKAVLREGRIRFENSQKTVDDGEDIIITRLK